MNSPSTRSRERTGPVTGVLFWVVMVDPRRLSFVAMKANIRSLNELSSDSSKSWQDARMTLNYRMVVASLVLLALPAAGWAKVKSQLVEYKQGDAVLEGYLAYDDAAAGKRPGVLVVHAWMGLD